MKKILKSKETIKFPFDSKTTFRVEQETNHCKDFTIIDAVTLKNGRTAVLLENDEIGEEWCVIALLPKKIINWLVQNDEPNNKKKVFLPYQLIIIDSAYNDITTELEEAGYIEDESEVEIWTQEEINNKEE